MNATNRPLRTAVTGIAVAFMLVFSTALSAETKVKIKGDVDEVTEQVEGAFTEMDVKQDDKVRTKTYSMTRGKAASGAELTVEVNRSSESECEITVSAKDAGDSDVEARFLRLMSSR